jgi:isoleucyl-tRNA synthetase
MMPFTPFLADFIYTNLTKEESAHLADWPSFTKVSEVKPETDRNLIREMQEVRDIVEKAHSIRKESGIPVRQPLGKLQITNYKLQIIGLEKILLDDLNIKNVVFKDGKGEIEVTLDTKITPELKEEADMRDLVRRIQEVRRKLGLNLSQKVNVSLENIPLNKDLLEWMIKKVQIANLKKGRFKISVAS